MDGNRSTASAFTLIELLIVIATIAVLATIVILVLNPAELLRQSRDANRLSDLATISSAMSLYTEDIFSGGLGNSGITYISVADPSATSTVGDQCQGLGLPSLASGSWGCETSSTYWKTLGYGWIPVNLNQISSGNPLGQWPVDPTNQTSSDLFYTYETNGTQYETHGEAGVTEIPVGGLQRQRHVCRPL